VDFVLQFLEQKGVNFGLLLKENFMQNNGCVYIDKINSQNIKNCHSLLDYYLKYYPHSSREEWIEKIRRGYIIRVFQAGVCQQTSIFCYLLLDAFFIENEN
jgi:hypothetical protein